MDKYDEKAKKMRAYVCACDTTVCPRVEAVAAALRESAAEALNEAIRCVHMYWRFDDNQQSLSGWHDKSDLIKTMMDDLAALRTAGEKPR